MPRWLLPWVVPLALAFVVIAVALGGGIGAVLIYVCVLGLAAFARRQQLKRNPPNPELVHKPFWRF